MKFAKDLEQELVPEWRAKYLNYKQGKKKIKAITRALRAIDQAPRTPSRRAFGLSGSDGTPQSTRPPFRHLGSFRRMRSKAPSRSRRERETLDGERSPTDVRPQETSFPETQPLRTPGSRFADHTGGYGSIISAHSRSATLPSLELPDPALDPNDTNFPPHSQMFQSHSPQSSAQSKPPRAQNRRSLPHSILPGPRNPFRSRSDSVPAPRPVRKNSFLQRMFVSRLPHDSPATKPPAEAFIEVRHREHEFFSFLDKELAKIEAFYRMKEEESTERLKLLKEQLHVMRDSRIEQLRSKARSRIQGERLPNSNTMSTLETGPSAAKWKGALKKTDPSSDLNKLSKELEELPTPGSTLHRSHDTEEYRDFVRKKEHDVPYRSAKRKLKVAILEYYRGLELLKAYAYLNRKAFRKINKKYDKATNARPTGRYIAEKVNKAWFVQSDLVENHLVAVEDLYTRYFERGNRKVAVTKLRGKATRSQDYSSNSFRNGLLFAAGLVLGIQGLVYAVQHLFNHGNNSSGVLRVQTGYLLQIYGGYSLILIHFLFFCLNCRIWTLSKINYVFVFEYDTRHVLDWRQLVEIPCFFVFLLGLTIWLNFRWINDMYIYWPVVLIGLTVLILFLPARILYHRSRKWFAYSNWRLLLAGLYPVEFRDFFLGDMYCSQTYAMGNLSLFFCLYGSNWLDPAHCNSSRSRAMGFLTTLPSIWRALQCLRRYRDTKNLFPHVVNFGKYSCSILYYMTLSLYRIKRVESLHALFISFALINAIYTSVWDVAMDWSLGNPFSKHPYLRDFLGFRRRWIYYAAMIIDPILRFNWIFYAIFIHDLQHSAILSFLVSLSEVFRRGIWSIFRVENEHCTNVGRFRAFRDVPLPYDLPSESSTDENQPGEHPSPQPEVRPLPIVHLAPSHQSTSVDVEHTAAEATPSTVRRRRSSHRPETPTIPSGTLARVGTMLANAHAEDFERRRRPAVVGKSHEELARHSMHENAGLGRDSSTEEEESDRSETEGAGDGESDLSLRLSSGSGCDDEDDDRVAKK